MSDFDDIDEQEAAVYDAAGEHTSEASDANSLKVPNDLSGLTPHRIPWSPNDYMGIAHGESARKLYSSAVAPVVAAARGYKQIKDEGRSAAKKHFSLPDWNTRQGRRLRESLKDDDVLIMPWYTTEHVVQGQNAHRDAEASTIQYRPEKPGKHDNGREAKYEFVVGSNSIIGLHPSTPQVWLTDSPTLIIAEGLLKADAAVSAMLIASDKISDDDLLMNPDPDFNHQGHLMTLMSKVERKYRIPVLCIGGVYNWKNNPEWNSLALKDKEVWIAIDGDIATNINVHRAGSQLWEFLKDKKHATTKLLSPEVVRGDGGEVVKMGVDDYLFEVGPWHQLLTQLSDRLPPRPPGDGQDQIGEWRVDEEGLTVSECVPVKDATGQVVGADWEKRVNMGGRIATIAQSRYPTKREDATGVLGLGVSDTDDHITVEVTVEVQWVDNEGAKQTANIVGPHTFLNYAPDQWDRHGAKIPHQVTTHHEWPPKGRQGQADGWLRAVKQSRVDEIVQQVMWQRMGWVPVKEGIPAFIAGEQTVAFEGAQDIAMSGVSERQLADATIFGVGEIADFDQSFLDEPYRAHVLEDLEKVMAAYVHARPWSNRGVAGLVLAAAMRPAIPIRPKGTLFIVGPPGKGKLLPLDARVPVPVSQRFPEGWALNRDLSVGDVLYGPDGKTAKVAKLSPICDDMDMFDFHMADGQVLRSSASHLWNVSTKNSRNIRDREYNADKRAELVAEATRLRELAATLSNDNGLTVSTLSRLTGHTYMVCETALGKAMTVHHDVVIYEETNLRATLYLAEEAAKALAGWTYRGRTVADDFGLGYGTWMNASEIARAAFGPDIDKKDARAVGRKVTAAGAASKAGFATIKKNATVFPSAESVLALATHLESRATYRPYTMTMTSEQIAALPRSEQVAIELAAPFDGPDADLAIDPYVLGAWLGDGTSNGGGFTSIDPDITDAIAAAGYEVTHSPTVEKSHYIKGIIPALRQTGVLNNKHIPAVYARASAAQRFELLRGLMDTDGYVNEDSGQAELALCDKTLATDALSLIRSLGIRAAMHESDAEITEMIDGERVHRVTGRRWRIRFTPNVQVFKMKRKAERVRFETSRHPVVVIDSIERLAPEPSQCITVDNATSLFLTEGFLPTHNSWTAGAFMGFWSREPGGWASDKLPGSAGDTAASIELAMSRAPAWIVDDYHPTTDSRKASTMHDKIADIVRYQFNGVAKRRATNTMGSMNTFPPNAALVVTGENELNIASVRQRLIAIEMREGALHESRDVTDDVVALCESDGAPARLTQGLIRYMQYRASRVHGSWAGLIEDIRDNLEFLEGQAEDIMANDSGLSKKRSANLFADYAITLHYLAEMAMELGWTEEQAAIFSCDRDDLGWDAMALVRSQFHDNREVTPGKSTLRAVRALLNAGKAHILNGDDHLTPPVSPQYDSHGLATQLGWSVEVDGSMRPKGTMIGYLVHRKTDGAPVLLLDHDNAFSEAARHYGTLIPAGQTVNSSWRSVQDEKLIADGFKPRNKGGVTVRLRLGGKSTTLASGVPIMLTSILDGTSDPDDVETSEEVNDSMPVRDASFTEV